VVKMRSVPIVECIDLLQFPCCARLQLILYTNEAGQVDLERFSILWRPGLEEAVVLQLMVGLSLGLPDFKACIS